MLLIDRVEAVVIGDFERQCQTPAFAAVSSACYAAAIGIWQIEVSGNVRLYRVIMTV
jgi:hypothetical protein